MAGMYAVMRKRAGKDQPVFHGGEIVKVIKRSDIDALNHSMEPAIRQNSQQRIASENAAAGSIFGGKI